MGLHQGAPRMAPPRFFYPGGDDKSNDLAPILTAQERVVAACKTARVYTLAAHSNVLDMNGEKRTHNGPLTGYFQAYYNLGFGAEKVRGEASLLDAPWQRLLDSIAWEMRGMQLQVEALAGMAELQRATDNIERLIDSVTVKAAVDG